MEKLANGYRPSPIDVICSRGKAAYCHSGNRSFRATLEHHLPSYANARSKQEKTEIVSLIFHGIQEATPQGGFIRKNEKGEWCRVPTHVAREKVGQGFRDLLHTEYRSSTKAKIKRRRDRLYPADRSLSDERDGQQSSVATAATVATLVDEGRHGEMPFFGEDRKISKSFSFDSNPLPLGDGDGQTDEMNLLRQCSFSFIGGVGGSDEKPHHSPCTSRQHGHEESLGGSESTSTVQETPTAPPPNVAAMPDSRQVDRAQPPTDANYGPPSPHPHYHQWTPHRQWNQAPQLHRAWSGRALVSQRPDTPEYRDQAPRGRPRYYPWWY